MKLNHNFTMRTILLTTISFFLSTTVLTAQIQIGQDIDGLATTDECGRELAISNSGNVVAVSSYFNDANGSDAGMVRIYNRSGNNWVQRGVSLLGDSIDDTFGFAVDLSANGNVVAVGIPYSARYYAPGTFRSAGEVKIYEWNGTTWNLKGMPLVGVSTQTMFGRKLCISNSGNRIAVSSDTYFGSSATKNEVRVYDWNGISWVQVGNVLLEEAVGDRFGSALSFSDSGSILAIGASANKGTTAFTSVGHCRVFTLNGSTWTQLGADIDGEVFGNSTGSGGSVALNDSGNVVVIGASGNDGNGANSGHVRVYYWNGSTWAQRGSDIDGEAAGDRSGGEVSVNSQGNIIAIGAQSNAGVGTDAGHARIYRWNGVSWLQEGTDIDGEGAFDESGIAVALDYLGVTVAIGGPGNSNPNGFSGHTRVYNLGNLVGVSELKKESVVTSISPNPFDKEFVVSFKQPTITVIQVRSMKGEVVYSSTIQGKSQSIIKLEVASGIYFVEIGEGASKEVYKVVKL